jgi:hypothetical protein
VLTTDKIQCQNSLSRSRRNMGKTNSTLIEGRWEKQWISLARYVWTKKVNNVPQTLTQSACYFPNFCNLRTLEKLTVQVPETWLYSSVTDLQSIVIHMSERAMCVISYINVINGEIYKRSCSIVTFMSSTYSPTPYALSRAQPVSVMKKHNG